MTTRFLYQPHDGHTTWGSFAAAHRGQTLREGLPSFHAPDLRLRDFDFDFFFLGTATVGLRRAESVRLERAVQDYRRNGRSVQLLSKRFERAPPIVGDRRLASARDVVAIDPTRRAQTKAVLTAQRRHRELEQDGFADHGGQVDLLTHDREGLVVGDRDLVQLPDLDVGASLDVFEAATASVVPRRADRAADDEAVRHALQVETAVDAPAGHDARVGQAQLVGRDRDRELFHVPGPPEQFRDVDEERVHPADLIGRASRRIRRLDRIQ
jgi:hypothetical protein